jgi:hypothetical protein
VKSRSVSRVDELAIPRILLVSSAVLLDLTKRGIDLVGSTGGGQKRVAAWRETPAHPLRKLQAWEFFARSLPQVSRPMGAAVASAHRRWSTAHGSQHARDDAQRFRGFWNFRGARGSRAVLSSGFCGVRSIDRDGDTVRVALCNASSTETVSTTPHHTTRT